MGFLEIILILLVIAAIYGRGPLALGVIFDFVIGLLVLVLLYRILTAIL